MSSADEPGERRGLLPRFTLKDGNTFLLADALGDIQAADDGLFTNDTRMLSRFELSVAGRRPSLLGAAINRDNTLFTAHLTNRPLSAPGELAIPKGVIHIERNRLLWRSRWYEQLTLTNFGDRDAEVPLLFCLRSGFRRHLRSAGNGAQGARRSAARVDREPDREAVVSWPGRRRAHDVHRVLACAGRDLGDAGGVQAAAAPRRQRRAVARDRRTGRRRTVAATLQHCGRRAVGRHAGAPGPGRIDQHFGPAVRPVDRPLARRSRAADDVAADRPVSVRRHPVVRNAVRARRDHHVAANALAQSAARSRRAELSRLDAGDGGLGVSRFAARQDHARDEARRDGGAAGSAVRPLLRRRRYDAAVRDARGCVREPHRRSHARR